MNINKIFYFFSNYGFCCYYRSFLEYITKNLINYLLYSSVFTRSLVLDSICRWKLWFLLSFLLASSSLFWLNRIRVNLHLKTWNTQNGHDQSLSKFFDFLWKKTHFLLFFLWFLKNYQNFFMQRSHFVEKYQPKNIKTLMQIHGNMLCIHTFFEFFDVCLRKKNSHSSSKCSIKTGNLKNIKPPFAIKFMYLSRKLKLFVFISLIKRILSLRAHNLVPY